MPDIQHADAVQALQILQDLILSRQDATMTYAGLCEALGRNATKSARYIGQVTSRIDAACFFAKTPFLALVKVRVTGAGEVNANSFADDLWGPHREALVRIAQAHTWTEADFKKIRGSLLSLGDDGAMLLWRRIGVHGQKAVQQALAVDSA